jgi:lipopolysaccharide biosynthesis glycosyltransferase
VNGDQPGFISSLLVFDHEKWREQRIFERCIALMNDPPVTFDCGDQSVLNYALLNNWHELPLETQAHAGHGTFEQYSRERIFTLHFLGTNPWEEIPQHLQPYPPHKLRARALWREYAA